jgi:hypothetical protein
MSTLAQRWQMSPITESLEAFRAQLSKLGVVDIGKVVDVSSKGTYAKVQMLNIVGDTINCEVISLGGVYGTIQDITYGQLALVLFPRSAYSIHSFSIDPGEQEYSHNYAKCIPIGCIKGDVSLNAEQDGLFISGSNYHARFTADSIEVFSDNIKANIGCTEGKAGITTRDVQINIDEDSTDVYIKPVYNVEGSLQSTSASVSVTENGLDCTVGSDIGFTLDSNGLTVNGDLTVTGKIVNDNLESPANA